MNALKAAHRLIESDPYEADAKVVAGLVVALASSAIPYSLVVAAICWALFWRNGAWAASMRARPSCSTWPSRPRACRCPKRRKRPPD